jgi:hypothetical protein
MRTYLQENPKVMEEIAKKVRAAVEKEA